jgi:DNA-binding HxlR family transcriptional regulator
VGYTQKSSYPGITPEIAASGVDEALKVLRSLVRDGVVSRLVHAAVPPKVEYSLTPRGQDQCPALDELPYWAQRWNGQPSAPSDTATAQKD